MSTVPRYLQTLLKSGLAILVLAAIFWTGLVTPQTLLATFARPGPALAALAILLAGAQLSVLRWHMLLGLQGSPLRFGQVWSISYASWFLGTFLPGAAGVDALRALYVLRERPDKRSLVFISILIDRLMGLAALLLLALGLLLLGPTQGLPRPAISGLYMLTIGGLLAVAAAPVAATHLNRGLRRLLHRFPRLERLATELDEAAHLTQKGWRRRPLRFFACMAMGIMGHVCVMLAIVLLARGAGVMALSTAQLALAGTLAVLLNQLPLTPGGLGVGELGFAQLCLLMAPAAGMLSYGSVILAFRLVTLVSYLPGALVLVTYRGAARAPSIAASTASTSESSSPG